MYLRRCSMSSISEESETGDDDQHDGESTEDNNNINQQKNQLPINLNVENCLGDLNIFKKVNFLFHLIILPVQWSFPFKYKRIFT
jgi:hypothetical protein